MKLFLLVVFACVCACAAQSDISSIPLCGQLCISSTTGNSGCSLTDTKCLCSSSTVVLGVRDCVLQSCSSADGTQTTTAFTNLCKVVGIDISSSFLPIPSVIATIGTSRLASAMSAQSSASMATVRSSPSTTTISRTSTVTPSASNSATAKPQSSGLTTGAKAGINVAILLAVALLAGLVYILWQKKRRSSATSDSPETAHTNDHTQSGLMVASHEDPHEANKPELDSTVRGLHPELDGTAIPARPELYSTTTASSSPPPPMYTPHQSLHTHHSNAHELATLGSSHPMQPSELSSTPNMHPNSNHHMPVDVGPAIVIPAPYRQEDHRIEQLRAQRAAVARDRERKEEIERMRAEEERLDKAIAELENQRY